LDEWKKDPPLFVEEWDPDNICSGTAFSATVNYLSGWNLVSLPVGVFDATYSSIYPDAVPGTLYGFNGTYIPGTVLENGDGYWLFFDAEGSNNVSGSSIDQITISLSEGWNLMGSLSSAFELSSIDDPEGIVVSGSIYGFEGTYQSTTTLQPGKGYWINASADGQVTLNSDGTARIKPFADRTADANVIRFNGIPLYFGITIPEDELQSYELPPKPPSGAFDVRFNGNMKVMQEEGQIALSNPTETLTVSYEIKHETGSVWVLVSNNGNEYPLHHSGTFQNIENGSGFTLKKESSLPAEYALSQNFPNPFNPTTTIAYSIPENSKVKLTIYNLTGRRITDLVQSQISAGIYSVNWDGTNDTGHPVSSGLYLYTIETDNFRAMKKMIYMK